MKHQGAGIGLYLCKKFIDLHGGKIWVEIRKPKGLSVFIGLFKNGAGEKNER